ncbi:MAG: hypothetical protein HYT09_01695 [Candidatus Levybacteria bacterium]|nr:hypothetical protein [Candidatus Levybacteria bacterium]
MKILILTLFLVSLKVLYNLYYFWTAERYYKEYKEYVKDSKSWFIKEHRQQIVKLFKKAGLEDTNQPDVEPIGYGLVSTGSFSVYRNLALLRNDIVIIINGQFREALGIYKQRIFEAFNPIYWVEQLIFLPRIIFSYLGIKSTNVIVKSAQLIWFLIGAVSIIVGIFFNKEFILWAQLIL